MDYTSDNVFIQEPSNEISSYLMSSINTSTCKRNIERSEKNLLPLSDWWILPKVSRSWSSLLEYNQTFLCSWWCYYWLSSLIIIRELMIKMKRILKPMNGNRCWGCKNVFLTLSLHFIHFRLTCYYLSVDGTSGLPPVHTLNIYKRIISHLPACWPLVVRGLFYSSRERDFAISAKKQWQTVEKRNQRSAENFLLYLYADMIIHQANDDILATAEKKCKFCAKVTQHLLKEGKLYIEQLSFVG